MYYIRDKESGKYFYDYVCGCIVWKNIQRAFSYSTKKAAEKDMSFLGTEDCEIVFVEEEL